MVVSKQTYIVAVSGGVDSVVLLHKLMKNKSPDILYVVVHVDHGIRDDSSEDAEFVRELAESYGLAFELKELRLGKNASEALAREQRYELLFSAMKRFNAEAIITAHHQDDVLETMIINMLRGTSPRGLIGFTRPGIMRPLLALSKREILAYADEHNLTWREDSTNQDTAYLRNYVRTHLMPKLQVADRKKLLAIRSDVETAYQEIDTLTKRLLVSCVRQSELVRSRFVVLPYIVQAEVMAMWLRLYGVQFDRRTIEKASLSAKTLLPGKHIELTKTAQLHATQETVVLKVQGAHV